MQNKRRNIKTLLNRLDRKLKKEEAGSVISLRDFLILTGDNPFLIFRNVFQLFHDMIYYYTTQEDEDGDDPENINFKTIITENLLVKNTDTPFFADLPLANRLLKLADSFKEGTRQNKIYIFIGPPGSGKSTFVTNLLKKFEEYTHLPQGLNYEILWKIDDSKLGPKLSSEIQEALKEYFEKYKNKQITPQPNLIELACPSHDHPFLIIPPEHRAEILENLLSEEDRIKIFNKKEYDWVFKKKACTICTSIYDALINRLESPVDVFDMVYAKRYCFDRRLGNGISVYNPGDRDPQKYVYSDDELNKVFSQTFKHSHQVKYVFSRYAKTNNGVFVIMDVKGYNEDRFMNLHGIISEGTHKIEDLEENINSMFIAVMNPEDKQKITSKESFKDRINETNVNYILNYDQEVKIYCHSFGIQIKKRFLPGVLNNFAKIIISSRLSQSSLAMKEWIKDPRQYIKYCDENLMLLKLSIYNNKVPTYLTNQDKKRFTKKIRKKLVAESEAEGCKGISGRESINIFNEFYNDIRKKFQDGNGNKKYILISMEHVRDFFKKHDAYAKNVPSGFIDSIIRLYNYNIMQQIKESLFHQNEERISRDIQNYLFALNYDIGEKLISPYTEEPVDISNQFFNSIEQHLFEKDVPEEERVKFRKETAGKFTVSLQEMQVDETGITSTAVYSDLYETYMRKLRENIFQPFLQYTSFENAIKEYNTAKFEVYDNKTKEQVRFLIGNLVKKFNYTEEGAIQVCLYVLDNKIAESFTK